MTPNFQYHNGGLKGKKKRRTARDYFDSKKYTFHHDPQQLDVQDRILEGQTRRRVSKLPLKCYEYSPEYEIVLPSAPALRSLPKRTIDSVVSRLYRTKKDLRQTRKTDRVESKLTVRNDEKKDTNGNALAQQPFRRCSYCDFPPLDFKEKHVIKTPRQIREMVDRLSVSKLYDSDFRMGKLIRFRTFRSIDPSGPISSSFPSIISLKSEIDTPQSFQTTRNSVLPETLPTRFPSIKPISPEEEHEIKVIITVKNKETEDGEKQIIERSVKSASPRCYGKSRHRVRTTQRLFVQRFSQSAK